MESGKGGGNSYWPGFVDALTNVIIAMIFVVVVLAIALSFAAQLMGKRVADKMISEFKAAQAASAASATGAAAPQIAQANPESIPVPESKRTGRTIIDVKGNEAASSPRRTDVLPTKNLLQLRYTPGALTLDDKASEGLRAALKDLGSAGDHRPVVLVASGPAMVLSDNQRSAFLRLMDVRNALIAQGYPADRISTRIDTQSDTAVPMISIAFTD